MSIISDIQKLEPGAVVDLFEIDLSSLGGGVLYIHPGKNNLAADITWNSVPYLAFPVKAEGFEATGNGRMPRPTIKVANVTGLISSLLRDFDDLIGCKVTRRRTFVKYLDAVNYPAKANILPNSAFSSNSSGWVTGWESVPADNDGTLARDLAYPDWTPTGLHTLGITRSGTPTGVKDFGIGYGLTQPDIPVTPNTRYCLSAYIAAHRCVADMSLVFLASDKTTQLGQFSTPTSSSAGGTSLSGWGRKFVFVTAPVGAAYVYVFSRQHAATAANPYSWICQPMLEIATGVQVAPSNWVDDGRNPSADPTQEFPPEIWFIDRKSSESKMMIEFELAASWDVQGVLLPRRQAIANTCNWKYKGTDCSYVGGPVADALDAATTNPALDSCGKRLTSCKLRFGATAVLPFGAFPAVGVIQ